MGVGPLANPGRAGKGAELEAAAITRNTKKQKKRRQKYLGDLQAQAYFTGIDREEERRKEGRELIAAMCTRGGMLRSREWLFNMGGFAVKLKGMGTKF